VALLVAGLHGEQSLGEVVHLEITEREFDRNRRITGLVLDSLQIDGLGHWVQEASE
jgi:hypothetical protein